MIRTCGECGSEAGFCVRCGTRYDLGVHTRCDRKDCEFQQVPMACWGCALDVDKNNQGVVKEGVLVPWRNHARRGSSTTST